MKMRTGNIHTFVPIRSVSDGLLSFGGKKPYCGILRVEPINFSLMSPEGQHALIEGFQEVLNGITSPFQILVRSLPCDLAQIVPPSAGRGGVDEVASDYHIFLRELASQRSLVSRSWYVIVPGEKTHGKNHLLLRMEEFARLFERLDLAAYRLRDEEVLPLVHSCLFSREPFIPPSSRDIPASILAPSSIQLTPFFLRIDGEFSHEYVRTLVLTHYPRHAVAGWLDALIQLDEPGVEISLHFQPLPSERIQSRLSHKAIEFRGSIRFAERQGEAPDAFSQHALKDVEELRDRLMRGEEHVFSLSLFILLRASTTEELDERTTRVQAVIRSRDFRCLALHWQHHLGWLCTLPYGENMLSRYGRLVGTRGASTFFPFTSATPSMERGVLFGLLRNGSLVIVDPFKSEEHPNANLAVFGLSGSGKSFFLKTILARMAPTTRLYVLDPEGEYRLWARHLAAKHVYLTSSSLQINPLDLYRRKIGNEQTGIKDEQNLLSEKLTNLQIFLALLVGEGGILTQKEKAYLSRCLIATYAERGITTDQETHTLPAPSMRDLLRHLSNDPYGLAERLEHYIELFPEQTTFPFEHPHLIFNIQQLPASLRPVGTFLVVERLWVELRQTREEIERHKSLATQSSHQSIIMIDEAWSLMEFEEGARFLSEFARRIRKYGGGLWVSTQRSNDFFSSEQGKTLLAMCFTKVLFKHDISSINEATTALHLNTQQRLALLTARRGEALFLGKTNAMLEVIASPKEHHMANTTLIPADPATETRFVPISALLSQGGSGL